MWLDLSGDCKRRDYLCIQNNLKICGSTYLGCVLLGIKYNPTCFVVLTFNELRYICFIKPVI